MLAYTMVAERNNQKVTKERTSALILLANARVWTSEGWQVSITDGDGKALDPAGFENWLGPVEASPLQPVNAAPLEADQGWNLSAVAEVAAEGFDESHEAYEIQRSEEAGSEEVGSEDAQSEDYHGDLAAPERAREDQEFSEANGSMI